MSYLLFFFRKVQPEDYRYQSVCHQLLMLSEQNFDEPIKKSPSSKLTSDDSQVSVIEKIKKNLSKPSFKVLEQMLQSFF